MVYNIGICEDEKVHLQVIVNQVKKYMLESENDFEIHTYENGNEMLKNYRQQKFDILFLDIGMQGLSGIETAEIIRSKDKDVVIIFITSYDNYALEAYRVEASMYLVKPLEYEDLKKTLDRVIKIINGNYKNVSEKKYITVKTNTGGVKLDLGSIVYIDKVKNKLYYYTDAGIYESYDTIKNVMDSIDSEKFVMVNQGQVVNWERVKEVDNGIIIVDNISLQVSRRNKENLRKKFLRELIDKAKKSCDMEE